MKYSGERLVKGENLLQPLRVENLARFNYFQKIAKGKLILDLGCGVGEGTEHLIEDNDQRNVVGVDISLEALIVAHKSSSNNSLQYTCMDVTKLAFADETIDAIVSVEVIEHIGQVQEYLREAYRVLKPRGLFFLTTPNRLISSPTPGSLWPDHVREYSPNELNNLLSVYFPKCEILGEYIPAYENNVLRKITHKVAPRIKPFLPKWLRIRALPMLQSIIKNQLAIPDVKITDLDIDKRSTLIACCYK